MRSVAALVVLAVLASANIDLKLSQFNDWAAKYGKNYATDAEFKLRFQTYLDNEKRIEAYNAEGHATFAMNQFGDLSAEEFKAIYLSSKKPSAYAKCNNAAEVTDEAPATWNWVDHNAVTPVKDQGSCGSCWAFSTIANLEGRWAISSGTLTSFAEQQLVDCDRDKWCANDTDKDSCDQGCNGGLMENAMRYVIDNGIEAESAYKYTGSDGTCKYAKASVVANFKSFECVYQTTINEHDIQRYVAKFGPVAIAVHADPWQFYFGGIYDSSSCKGGEENLDHGVALVGWGTDSGKDYWIVKNSWGKSWGKSGYIWVVRNKDMCGIAEDASSIIV